jgi:hypothetical protein
VVGEGWGWRDDVRSVTCGRQICEVELVEKAEDYFVNPDWEYQGAIRYTNGEPVIRLIFWLLRPVDRA